jgi:CRP-like cAMP-binding protein
VIFIVSGRVKFYYDVNFKEPEKAPKLRPFNLHVQGSYFGDNDVLCKKGKDGRDSTAIVSMDSQLLVITKESLMTVLRKFPSLRKEMRFVAAKRSCHHEKQIRYVIQQYQEDT